MTLASRWARLVRSLGSSPEAGARVLADLDRRYREPHRRYHGWRHVASCLRALDRSAGLCDDRHAVELALWFHDAVYDPGKPGNEERSAALLAAAADVMGLAPVTRDHAAAIVRATAHAAAGGAAAPDPDTAVALDIDLAVLGRPAAGFDRYEAAVREEFGFLGETEWREGRRRLLQGFLARPRIYLTDRFSAAYEARARRNLQRSLARLNAPSGRPPTRRR